MAADALTTTRSRDATATVQGGKDLSASWRVDQAYKFCNDLFCYLIKFSVAAAAAFLKEAGRLQNSMF